MTVLVSLHCGTGFLARYSDLHRARKATHVARLTDGPQDVLGAIENFRLRPEKQMEFARRLPMRVVV